MAWSTSWKPLVEGTTRFVLLLHLPADHTAEAVRDTMLAKIPTLPEHLCVH